MLHRIALARDDGLQFVARLVCNLLQGHVFQLVPDKNLTLVFRKFFQGGKQFLPEKFFDVGRFPDCRNQRAKYPSGRAAPARRLRIHDLTWHRAFFLR